ncbi:DJ-1/PfpI family protein [Mastigocoleus testarum]|uniref:DJ-1/PfpI domain-containing protein n=1 Tax=Mastigocoleus testarum BC008 TaxID=371196 RepID=A0A0V7ZBV3_9CYAN|nr:DJ-1/PfpI family protein [Mastigocoleus testarum]KST61782.1 hypothetical protein BC008_06980 [Mastigocoleus testarum BC008]
MDIAILLYDGFTALDAVGPYEVLSRLPEAKVYFVAKNKGPIITDNKILSLVADFELSEVLNPDIILIPGGIAGTLASTKDEIILDWVRTTHRSSQWTTSVCTGSLILGAAGILQGLKATTHWFARDFISDFGAEYVNKRFIQEGKIITAAGVSAGVDMALHLAKEIAGSDIAQTIQLLLEYDPQPPLDSGSLEKASAKTIEIAKGAVETLMA